MSTFNRDVRDLPELLRRYRELERVEDMDANHLDFLLQLVSTVRTMLTNICNSQTDNAEVAKAAALNARLKFLKALSKAGSSSLLGWIISGCVVCRVPANVWLFLIAVKAVDEVSVASFPADEVLRNSNSKDGAPAGRTGAGKTPMEKLVALCRLREVALRPKSHVNRLLLLFRRSMRRNLCRKRCMLIMLEDFGFNSVQMAMAVGLGRETTDPILRSCHKQRDLIRVAQETGLSPAGRSVKPSKP